ncbi:hypothetical protein FB45DRAFT_1031585 [Roridomyces roridus]|uniref:F-box domain-containing protein n=1 Tax=Roridomyces roridus TaxID=1738132 RepID=A0AAD7FGZ2_9AGAR|nr:hypothetical protein FB45DRAFT_1031585 [Roridomyces roridus]
MSESTAPTTLSFPPDLVPEIHALILSNLLHKDLLRIKYIAKKWKAIDTDCRKRPCHGALRRALQRMSWSFSQTASKAGIYLRSEGFPSLASAGVLDDLATIRRLHFHAVSGLP